MTKLKIYFAFLIPLFCYVTASAHDFEVDGIYYNITSDSDFTVTVTFRGSTYISYSNEYSGDVTIPEKVIYDSKEYSVTSIGERAFYNCSGLTSVAIPNSVTSIENYAFYLCSALTSLIIPNSVTNIGAWAFYGCSGLTNLTIPNSVTNIGSSAFYDCTSLSCVFNESDLSITKGSTSNGYVAYYAKCVVKGKGEIIDDYVFRTNETDEHYLCGYLGTETVITLPEKYRGEDYGIDESAFSGNADLASVTIPNSVISIGYRAFYGCSGLTSMIIPNSVTSIGNSAFEFCSGLTSVTIPNSVTSIGDHAFYGCSGLTSVTIPNSVTSIGSSAFDGCSGLTSVTIPNSVTSIGSSAFSRCSGLTSVTIPNSVTSIGSSTFSRCSGLTSVTIPNSVTSIGDHAFAFCSGLTNVIIPNSVTSIGDYAFGYCSGLTSVTIPNSVTSIGSSAFMYCSALTSVTIPNSVTSIGSSAFYGCIGELTVNCNIPSVGSSSYSAFGGSKFSSVIIGENVMEIGSYAFYDCSGLTSVTIPNSVTSIGRNAFYNCKSLYWVFNESDLSITKGSTSNGYVAYYAKCVVKGKGEIIDDYVFRTNETDEHYLCGYLGTETVITLPEKYRGEDYGIDESAFSGNADLVSVTIPNSVTSIGEGAFFNCTSLTSVYIERENPMAVDYSVFACKNKSNSLEEYIPNEATLYVPYDSKAAYENETGWSTFKNIVEINPIVCEIKDTAVIIEKELSLPISIRNDVGIAGFQCDIYIPEGLTLKTNEKGEYDISLNEERYDDHSIYMRQMPDGAVRIIVMSMSSSAIVGTEGNILTLNLVAGDSIGNYKVEVKNFNASDQKGKLYNANDTTGTVAVYYIPGDVNNDGIVAVNDIVYVVNYLLEDVAPDFHFSAADMDGDGNVFINDVVLLVNKILNMEPNAGQANN